MVSLTRVFRCLHDPHAVEIFFAFCAVGEERLLSGSPDGGRGTSGLDMTDTVELRFPERTLLRF
jgi:hypothetical protein